MKSELVLGEIDFTSLAVGDEMYAYEYVSDSGAFEYLYSFYPLFYGGEFVAMAISSDGVHYQIDTEIMSELQVHTETRFALVYDASGCWLYNESGFCSLVDSENSVLGRLQLLENNRSADSSVIELEDCCVSGNLGYSHGTSRASSGITFSLTHYARSNIVA